MAHEYIDITTGSLYFYTSSYTLPSGSNKLLNFKSISHLYYSNFDTGSGVIETTGSYDNFIESSLSTVRKMSNEGRGIIFSVPKKLYGTHLEPGTIKIVRGANTYTDDGEGNLNLGATQIGNVIYSHGMIIITNNTYADEDIDSLSFKSNLPIHTHNYTIKISDYEFNHTLNPTAQSGSSILEYSGSKYLQPSGKYANNVTGSDFQPYITTVGLYNDSNELLLVGKLAQPLPKPADTELTIQIKLDV